MPDFLQLLQVIVIKSPTSLWGFCIQMGQVFTLWSDFDARRLAVIVEIKVSMDYTRIKF